MSPIGIFQAVLLLLIGAVLGVALAFKVNQIEPSEHQLPAPDLIYRTLDSTFYGYSTRSEEFVGAPGRCWISHTGQAYYDDTGVRVPEVPMKRP